MMDPMFKKIMKVEDNSLIKEDFLHSVKEEYI
jgi:hypothetical protein